MEKNVVWWLDTIIIHAQNLLETAILQFILDQTYKISIIYKARISIELEVVWHPCKKKKKSYKQEPVI